MNNSPYTPPNSRLENQLQQIYQAAPFDPAFSARLEEKLTAKLAPRSEPAADRRASWPTWLRPSLRALAWSGALVLLAVVLVWSINHLVALPGQTPLAGSDETPTAPPVGIASNLVGTHWRLDSLNGVDLIANVPIDLAFDETFAGGSAGCNDYKWTYAPEGTVFPPAEMTVTVEGCIEPEGILEQEQAYLDALRQTSAYQQSAGRLELLDAAGQVLLRFSGAAATPEDTPQPVIEPTAEPTPPAFAIYLLEGDAKVSDVFQTQPELDALVLKPEPILSSDDLLGYDPESYVMQVSPEGSARLHALRVPVDGVPFVVCAGEERIYAGAFWTSLSSLSFDNGVVIDVLPAGQTDRLRFQLGYPESPEHYQGQDPRGDARIIDALTSAGKISPTPLETADSG